MTPRTKEKFQEIREKSQKKIFVSAMKVFARYGFYGATIDKIAKEAGISKGLIYNYYKSKDELFNDIVKTIFDELEEIMKFNNSNLTAKEKLKIFINTIFDKLKENTETWKLYTSILLMPQLTEKFYEVSEKYFVMFFPMMKELYPNLTDKEIELEFSFFSSQIDGIIYDYVIMPDIYPLEKIKEKLIKMYCE